MPTSDEHDNRLGDASHATVGDVNFGNEWAQVSIVGRALLRAAAGEQVIHDWNIETVEIRKQIGGELKIKHVLGAASWSKKTPDFKLPYGKAVEVLALPREGMVALEAKLSDLHAFVALARTWMHQHSKGSVVSMFVRIPVGTLLCPAPAILFAEIDALELAWQRGDQAVRDQVLQAIKGIYAKPDRRIKELGNGVWEARGLELDGAIKCAPNFESLKGCRNYYVREDRCIRPGSEPPKLSSRWMEIPTTRVTGVTPLGVELKPWLAGITEAAL